MRLDLGLQHLQLSLAFFRLFLIDLVDQRNDLVEHRVVGLAQRVDFIMGAGQCVVGVQCAFLDLFHPSLQSADRLEYPLHQRSPYHDVDQQQHAEQNQHAD